MKKDVVNKNTGEVHEAQLNEVVTVVTLRKNGSVRIQQDFSNCPSMAEQHTAHLTNINYLMEKFKPDELAAYVAARNSHRQEIIGHDFSREPNLQDAHNIIYRSKQEFENLSEDIKQHFKSHLEFLKFIDNPANEEKMYKLGILTKKQVEAIKIPEDADIPRKTTTTTKEEEATKRG